MWTWKADRPVAVIVIIHGASEYHGRYKWLIEMWRSSGYHVVMGDLPGQGTTTRARGHIRSFQEYIDEVDAWIDKARTFDLPVFLLGHSMGGLVAIEWVKQQRNPRITGIILSSPCLGLQIKVNKALDLASKGLNVIAPSLKVDSGLSIDMATRNEDVIEADQNDSLYVRKVSVRWYRELLKTIESAMVPTEAFLKVPLLVMQAGDDKLAWHLFAIFVATIIGFISKPLPMGAIAIFALAVTALTGTLSIEDTLSGFGNKTIWLIVIAFFISRGFIKTGLGARISYVFVQKFGKKTLGLSYSLLFSDLILSPAIPSNTARAGGIIFPIIRSLSETFGSSPANGTERKIGAFLLKTGFQGNLITSAMFLTAMAANPLIAKLAHDVAGVDLTWTSWAIAAIVPGLVS